MRSREQDGTEPLSRWFKAAVALGLSAVYFLVIPFAVYALNLTSVGIPKVVIAVAGTTAAVVVAVFFFALFATRAVGRHLTIAAGAAILAMLALVVFPNWTGEIAGFEDAVGSGWGFVPVLKLLVLIVGGIVWGEKRAKSFRLAVSCSIAVSMLASAGIFLFAISSADATRRHTSEEDERLLELGKGTNAIVLALDTFTGFRMREILQGHPGFKDKLDGFTLFPKAIASALNTPAGSSALITGTLNYAIEVDDSDERSNIALRNSFLSEANAKGLNVSYISALIVDNPSIPNVNEQEFFLRENSSIRDDGNRYLVFLEAANRRVLPTALSRFLRRIEGGVFRSLPLGNPAPGNDLASLTSSGQRMPVAGKLAFERFRRGLQAGSGKPRVIYYLSKLSHPPWNFTDEGKFKENAGYESSSLFSATQVLELIARLKAIGVYDNTLLIVTSDHGGIPLVDARSAKGPGDVGIPPTEFNPLIMVKPPGSHHPYRESKMTVWLGDVAATVRDALGLPAKADPRFETRSLIGPDDPLREISVPIFFRPEELSYHGPLKDWIRVDVHGTFEAYVRAGSNDPNDLLEGRASIVLKAGEDERAAESIRKGEAMPDTEQYALRIEINGRLLVKVPSHGIAVVTDASGEFTLTRFPSAKEGVAFLRRLPESSNTLACGVRIPIGEVRDFFGSRNVLEASKGEVNFAFAKGDAFSASVPLKISNGDVQLEVKKR